MTQKLIKFALATALALPTAHAAVVINPLGWGLTPGTTFRLVLPTNGTTHATSANIADYDTFVNTQGLIGITYNGSPLTWQALGLTAGSNPVTDLTRFSSQANSVPVYNLNGAQVSNTSSNPFWKGSSYSEHLSNIDYTINGSGNLEKLGAFTYVWTGFENDGAAPTRRNYESNGDQIGTVTSSLGSSSRYNDYYPPMMGNPAVFNQNLLLGPSYGRVGATANGWAAVGDDSSLTTQYRMYALSAPITVTAAVAVPEPHAGFAAAAMVAGCLIYRFRRVRPTRKN